MNLRRQLLIVSLLTLVLPWAGCQFIKETESALREGQQQMLSGTTQAIAESLSQHADLFASKASGGDFASSNQVYAQPLTAAPFLDGYIDDWNIDPASMRQLRGIDGSNFFIVGIDANHVYFYASVTDRKLVFAPVGYDQYGPATRPAADYVELVTNTASGDLSSLVFAPEAPGPLSAWMVQNRLWQSDPRVQGYWQDTPKGYQLEARIPRSLLGTRFGLSIFDTSDASSNAVRSSNFAGKSPGLFISASPDLQALANNYAQPGLRLIVTNDAGWRLAQAGSLVSDSSFSLNPRATPGWLRIAYDALLEPGQEAQLAEPDPSGQERQIYISESLHGKGSANWFRQPNTGRAVIAVARPVMQDGKVIGSVILQQTTGAILSLTNQALARLISITLLAAFIAAAGLLGYASWLSLRIRNLSNAAEVAIGRGILAVRLPSSTSGDELGALSRSFSNILQRIGEYNAYLKTLASKLSHELRTPLTIVTSSLDNLEHEAQTEASAEYIARARDGAQRLRKILASMSEANRVEELVENVEPSRFDLSAIMQTAVAGYTAAYPERIFEFESATDPAFMYGAPELIIQMLDKLIANAVDFSAAGQHIHIGLQSIADDLCVTVSNPGPPLPANMSKQLFNSMVSLRSGHDEEHLGLGLYVARLICEGHGGRISARDIDGGVEFTVHLPAAID